MPDIVVNLLVMLGAKLFFGLVDAGLANKEPEAVAEPPAIVAPEPVASSEEIAKINAEVDELRVWLRAQGHDASGGKP